MRKILICLIFLALLSPLFGGEVLESPFSLYGQDMRVFGFFESPSLNIHTFSLNEWSAIQEDVRHPWRGNFPENGQDNKERLDSFRYYGPDAFFSYNSSFPQGSNDGVLWQGRGFNSKVQGGASFTSEYFSAVFFPVVTASQNVGFDYVVSSLSADYPYSYYVKGIDYPQRMGTSSFYQLDFGESEVRLHWKNLSLGFGNQSIWIGPGERNAILLSNNSGGFPKLDIGLKKTETPAGAVEFLLFWGMLSESNYFDQTSGDSHNGLSGLSLSYAPNGIFKGIVLGFHRTLLNRWSDTSFWKLIQITNPNPSDSLYGSDLIDQRMALTFEWNFPLVGFTVYSEWARNDHSGFRFVLISPEHTQAFTIGFKKVMNLESGNMLAAVFELTDLMNSRDYEINMIGTTQSGFYNHHIITQGYTQNGQILGAGIGPGADSQYLGLRYYYPKGELGGYLYRKTGNKDYIYGNPDRELGDYEKLNVELGAGLTFARFAGVFLLYGDFSFGYSLNRNYVPENDVLNFHGETGIRYLFK